jgi:putative ABC transport system permease protein
MDSLWQDIRLGARKLARTPGFTLAAAATLALGIGANTAIFSLVDTVLLRPLPFPDAGRLALLWETRPGAAWPQLPMSFPNFTDVRSRARSFQDVAAWTSRPETTFNLTIGGEPQPVPYALATANFFDVLGVAPAMGRAFGAGEAQPGDAPAVVLSHGLWLRLGADPALVGGALRLGDRAHEVVGVLPPRFRFANAPREPLLWLSIEQQPDPTQSRRYARAARYLGVVARLRPDASIATARAEMETIAARFRKDEAGFFRDGGLQLVPLQEQAVANLRPTLLVLLGAVAFVLLIACANVAGLMLARGQGRRGEMALRTALGAPRRRLVRQLLTETLLLGLAGGALGLATAFWGLEVLASLSVRAGDAFNPYAADLGAVRLDARALLFTLALSLGTAVVFGLLPALQTSRADLAAALDATTRVAGGASRSRARRALIVAEVGLALVLLVGAGLMLESLRRLQRVDPGFHAGHVLTAEVRLPSWKYGGGEKVAAFYDEALARLLALPGVQAVGAVSALPLSGAEGSTGVLLEGAPELDPAARPSVHHRAATPEYFAALGIPLRRGRVLTARDDARAPKVAVVNETMARRLWPGQDPIGRRLALDFEAMRFFRDRAPELDLAAGLREVVGVVADVRHSSLDGEPGPQMYVPFAQRPSADMTLVVRSSLDPAALTEAARGEVRSMDPEQPLAHVTTMAALVEASVAPWRFNLRLLGAFALLALFLAAVGLYGVVSHSVAQRTAEIGVRMALGAERSHVLRLVIGEGLGLAVLGIALGAAAALGLGRTLSALLYGVRPTEPAAFVAAAVSLAAVAVGASGLPAWRASRVDPMTALRNQ